MTSSMNKKELKKFIKECVKEVIFEDGIVSDLVSEIAAGFVKANLLESRAVEPKKTMTERVVERSKEPPKERESYRQNKKRMTESLNKMFGGVDVFEGTTPAPAPVSRGGKGALSGVQPGDKGVDISNIPGMNNWKHLIK
tara:strand:- start:664 stop:1083 length:420 start_codon:yes stop_codon:yes gene_type:complete